MRKQKENTLYGRYHHFNYNDRKHELCLFVDINDRPANTVGLNTGQHVMVDADLNPKKVGYTISCHLRHFIYRKLNEYGYEDNVNYIVILDAPEAITKAAKKTFIGLDVQFPNRYGIEFKLNEEFAKEIINEFHSQIKNRFKA